MHCKLTLTCIAGNITTCIFGHISYCSWCALQVHDVGTWSFKGIAKPYPVVQIVPSCLMGRLLLMGVKSGPKATCIEPASGQVGSVCVDMVSLSQIMYNPNDADSAAI